MAEWTPYLRASVVYLVLALGLARLTLSPRQARLTWWSGAVHLPAAFLAPTLEPGYWAPVRTGGVAFGFEDVAITLAVAVWSWYLVALRFDGRLGAPAPLATAFRRSLAPGAAVVGAYLAAWALGAEPMTALLAVCVLAAVALALGAPRRIALAGWGAAAMAAVWFVLVWVTYAAHPEFATQWNAAGPWGRSVAGVPLGEIVWAAAFGAFWPSFLAHVFAVSLGPPGAGGRSDRRT